MSIINELRKHIKLSKYDYAVDYFISNINTLFSTPNIELLYETVLKIPRTYFKTHNQILMYGWLCFANGNYKNVSWVLSSLENDKSLDNINRASYLALYSMSLGNSAPHKSLELSKKAIESIPEDDTSIIKANVYMSYGRQLASLSQYSASAKIFNIAAKTFEINECLFLAISCYTNEVLNYYYLGNHKELLEKCTYYLKMSSSYDTNMPNMWKLLKLPMAMSYYVLNKRSISLNFLTELKNTIDSNHLPHLHGLVELYLFRIYYIENKEKELESLLNNLESFYKNLEFSSINYLIISLRMQKSILFNEVIKKEWIEQLELQVDLQKEKTQFYMIEALIKIKQNDSSAKLSLEYINKYFDSLQVLGHHEDIQSCALYLAEFYYKKNIEKAKYYFQIAYKIYKDTSAIINFYNRRISFLDLIDSIDHELLIKIYQNNPFLKDSKSNLLQSLTKRELEILQVMSKGKSNKEIANDTFISEGTVKWHLANIYSKLGVKNRVEALDRIKDN